MVQLPVAAGLEFEEVVLFIVFDIRLHAQQALPCMSRLAE